MLVENHSSARQGVGKMDENNSVPAHWYKWSEQLALSPFAVSYLLALVKDDTPEAADVSMQRALYTQLQQLSQAK